MVAFLAMFVIFYLTYGFGVTVGYHRLLAHRSFSCPKLVEYWFVAMGYMAFMTSPIWWTTIHRAHHRYTDTDLDPHSPRNGFWHSHSGWFFMRYYPAHLDPAVQAPDICNDPIYRVLECGGDSLKAHLLNSAIGTGFRVVLWMLFGWQVALASMLAGLLVQQVPLFLNALCHIPKLGYRVYDTTDDSVNVPFVAFFSLGEGWHNNHHAFPGSARQGLLLHEFDPSWFVIKFLQAVGLATRVNEASAEGHQA